MSIVREIAYAKINLALHVREKQHDHYHRIETIFAFCEDGDELSGSESHSFSLDLSGEFADALGQSENLVANAANAFREATGSDRAAQLHLTKRLPVASGVGGGSADAAAAFRLLNRMWQLQLPLDQLKDIARGVGTDVPACVLSRTMFGKGTGAELEPIDLGLAGTPVLLVNPRVELRTGDVFARWDGVDRGPLDDWREGRNDLEAPATSMVPQIGAILAWLSVQRGATHVRMSGSGATCFAMFEDENSRDHAATAVPREWWRLVTRLR